MTVKNLDDVYMQLGSINARLDALEPNPKAPTRKRGPKKEVVEEVVEAEAEKEED